MGRVQDRVAVITGAANGLGQAIARRLAEEGARVVLGGLDASGLERTAASITTAGGVALPVVGDLTEEAPAAQLIHATVERFGRLDMLGKNVGGRRTAKSWELTGAGGDFILCRHLPST